MAVFAMLSAGGSPGVTTTALALALSWPTEVVVAECDPSGGDILAGLLSGHLPATSGLLPLALEAGAGAEVPADVLWRQLVELDEEGNRLLLAGISDPRQSAALQSSLPWIAEALQGLRADVLADCGRLDALAAVRPVLSAASLAILVLRPTLRQVSRAIPRVEMLANLMGPGRVVVLLVGDGAATDRELAKTLGVPVAGHLPADAKTAGVLSDGIGSRRRLDERPLIRAAAAAGRGIRAAVESAGARPGVGGQPVYSPYAPEPPGLDGNRPRLPGLAGDPAERPGLDRPAAPQPGAGAGSGPACPQAPGYPEARPSGWDPADVGWPALMSYDQFGADQYRAFGAGQDRADQYGADQLGADQHGADQLGADRYGAGQQGAGPDDPSGAAAESDGAAHGHAPHGHAPHGPAPHDPAQNGRRP
jgi:hypothetical protein